MSGPNAQDLLRQYTDSLSHVLPKAVGTNLILWSSVSVGPFDLASTAPVLTQTPTALHCSPLQHSTSTKQGISFSFLVSPGCRPAGHGVTRTHRVITTGGRYKNMAWLTLLP